MNFLFNSVDLEKALKDLRPKTTRVDLDVLFDRIKGYEQLRKATAINIRDCKVTMFKGAAKLIGG